MLTDHKINHKSLPPEWENVREILSPLKEKTVEFLVIIQINKFS